MVEVDKTRIFLLIALFGFLAFSAANAEDIIATVKTIDGTASPGQTLSYKVFFYNPGDSDIDISTNTFLGNPDFRPSNAFTIPSKETQTLNINISIGQSDANTYGSLTGRTTYHNLLVFDEDGKRMDYQILLPAKIINPKAAKEWAVVGYSNVYTGPEKIDPKENFTIKTTINNPLKKVSIDSTVKSEDFVITPGTITIPNGTNEITIEDLKIPSDTKPGKYNITLKLLLPDDTLDIPITLDIGGYSDCIISEKTQKSLLSKTYTASVTVEGNKEKNCKVSNEIFGLERNLIKDATEGYRFSEKNITWTLTVQPGETKEVGYRVNYTSLVMIPFLIILIIGAWWYLTRQVKITKEMVDYRRHPGFMDLKIQIKVKNLSNKDLEKVKLIEPLPAFVKEVRDYGTVPGKTVKYKGKKSVKWDIDYLKAKEERVFSYKIRTSVEVLGKINFPPSILKYVSPKGDKKEDASNILSIEVE